MRFGPPRMVMPENFDRLARDWWMGRVNASQAGRQLGISRKTFTRRAAEWGASAGFTGKAPAQMALRRGLH